MSRPAIASDDTPDGVTHCVSVTLGSPEITLGYMSGERAALLRLRSTVRHPVSPAGTQPRAPCTEPVTWKIRRPHHDRPIRSV